MSYFCITQNNSSLSTDPTTPTFVFIQYEEQEFVESEEHLQHSFYVLINFIFRIFSNFPSYNFSLCLRKVFPVFIVNDS